MKNLDKRNYSSPHEPDLTVDQSAIYCIRVIGHLDESWSDRLGGLKITSSSREGKTAVTTLSGPVIDQAALFGVLKAIYDMRMPLVSVELYEADQNHNSKSRID